jgi:phosphoribosylanthranilate isomerase
MFIKICGLRDNFQEVLALNPDFAGLIFYEKSPRYAAESNIAALKQKYNGVRKTGVFVNENYDKISEIIAEYNLDFVQLHGSETPEFCAKMREKVPVIKAFGISSKADLLAAQNYVQCVDYLLFDTKTKDYGGSGLKFDWEMLEDIVFEKQFFLSGGISLEDLEVVKKMKIRNLAGVDLNSRFEDAPGVKNIEKLQQAINILRK